MIKTMVSSMKGQTSIVGNNDELVRGDSMLFLKLYTSIQSFEAHLWQQKV